MYIFVVQTFQPQRNTFCTNIGIQEGKKQPEELSTQIEPRPGGR